MKSTSETARSIGWYWSQPDTARQWLLHHARCAGLCSSFH